MRAGPWSLFDPVVDPVGVLFDVDGVFLTDEDGQIAGHDFGKGGYFYELLGEMRDYWGQVAHVEYHEVSGGYLREICMEHELVVAGFQSRVLPIASVELIPSRIRLQHALFVLLRSHLHFEDVLLRPIGLRYVFMGEQLPTANMLHFRGAVVLNRLLYLLQHLFLVLNSLGLPFDFPQQRSHSMPFIKRNGRHFCYLSFPSANNLLGLPPHVHLNGCGFLELEHLPHVLVFAIEALQLFLEVDLRQAHELLLLGLHIFACQKANIDHFGPFGRENQLPRFGLELSSRANRLMQFGLEVAEGRGLVSLELFFVEDVVFDEPELGGGMLLGSLGGGGLAECELGDEDGGGLEGTVVFGGRLIVVAGAFIPF